MYRCVIGCRQFVSRPLPWSSNHPPRIYAEIRVRVHQKIRLCLRVCHEKTMRTMLQIARRHQRLATAFPCCCAMQGTLHCRASDPNCQWYQHSPFAGEPPAGGPPECSRDCERECERERKRCRSPPRFSRGRLSPIASIDLRMAVSCSAISCCVASRNCSNRNSILASIDAESPVLRFWSAEDLAASAT